MKRRSFLTGLFASSALLGVSLKSEAMNILKPKTEEEQFYEFFEKFNGFPISDLQKNYYDWYKKDYKMMSMGRQTGTTTFLITLSAWLSQKGKEVIYFSHTHYTEQLYRDIYCRNSIQNLKISEINSHPHPIFLSTDKIGPISRRYDYALFDNCDYEVVRCILPHHPGFSLRTISSCVIKII
jgi:hypothetical protein